jgi:uncharacterized membrane protein YeaQ/YmgE (transglycosylase-associated protein family)
MAWLVILGLGSLVGFVVRAVVTLDRQPLGFTTAIVLGVMGAFLATWLAQATGLYFVFDKISSGGAVAGALMLLVSYHLTLRAAGYRQG